jgi:hypothetical protein
MIADGFRKKFGRPGGRPPTIRGIRELSGGLKGVIYILSQNLRNTTIYQQLTMI